jgi:hypothetical protein
VTPWNLRVAPLPLLRRFHFPKQHNPCTHGLLTLRARYIRSTSSVVFSEQFVCWHAPYYLYLRDSKLLQTYLYRGLGFCWKRRFRPYIVGVGNAISTYVMDSEEHLLDPGGMSSFSKSIKPKLPGQECLHPLIFSISDVLNIPLTPGGRRQCSRHCPAHPTKVS